MIELRIVELEAGVYAVGVSEKGDASKRPWFIYEAATPFKALGRFLDDGPEYVGLSTVRASDNGGPG